MYTFRINNLHRHAVPKEIKKKQVKPMPREEVLNNKIVSPEKSVDRIKRFFK